MLVEVSPELVSLRHLSIPWSSEHRSSVVRVVVLGDSCDLCFLGLLLVSSRIGGGCFGIFGLLRFW